MDTIDNYVDFEGMSSEARPFAEAGIFLSAAARVLQETHLGMTSLLIEQAAALFAEADKINKVSVSSGAGDMLKCKDCGSSQNQVDPKVSAEVDSLVNDIKNMMSED